MAYQVVDWVLKHAPADLSSGDMMVAVVLANHADAQGHHAYPSIAALAEGAHIGERQVIRCLQRLVRLGVIAVERPATNRLPTMYRFPVLRGDIADTPRGDTADTPTESRGDISDTVGVTFATSRGDICDTHIYKELEPSEKPSEEPPDLPVIEQPYHVLQALCDATTRDIRKLTTRERNSQLAVAKRLLADGVTCAEVRGYVGYLTSQDWRTEPVTMFTVEKGIGTWRASGAPAQPRGRASPSGKQSVSDGFADLTRRLEQESKGERGGNRTNSYDAEFSVSPFPAVGPGHGEDP